MTPVFDEAQLERFRIAITSRLGLHFDESRLGFLSGVLRRRLAATKDDVEAHIGRLEGEAHHEALATLARELTVPETYFFRHIDQFRAFNEIVLPECLAAANGNRPVCILSLGCASGEEAYSLAMEVRDTLLERAGTVSIVGVDVNAAMLDKARRGRFSAWALRETPEHDRRRWFQPQGRDFVLDENVRASVRFEERNLADDDPQFWQPETWDVVFCRNVIMYFAPEQAEALIARIARALRPGGYLFLGHAETLRGVSNDYHLRHTHGAFYYQRKERSVEMSAARRPSSLPHPSRSDPPTAAPDADTDAWVDAIRRASERVATLTTSREARMPRGADAKRSTAAWDLSCALEFLRNEQFGAALSIVDALPPESSRDPDVLLLRAVLLAHRGELAKAEDACRRLLDLDELSAGGHYLLALCREGAGDHAAAEYHDQIAAYLDPGFAMPHLHLGLLARRSADRATARRELGRALALLNREEASRVLLFGGGFGREALMAICRTELRRCGGKV